MTTEEGSPRALAMIEFVGTFASLTGSAPESLADLSDGVTLFEALSEIAPMYFDPTTIARHLGDNWALKSSNLRKLIRNLEDYYHEGLYKTADFAAIPLTAIAKESDPEGIANLVELVAGAAVTCADKGTYVQRILGMSPENQMEMKAVLEQSLSKLSDYVDDDDEGDENELVFDMGGAEEEEDDDAGANSEAVPMFGGHHVNDGMEEDLLQAQRELSSVKSQLESQNQDNERAQQKLRAVVEDLQDRLVKRQDDLIQLEEDLRSTTNELEDAKAKLADTEMKNSQLADDLDVAQAKAQQLYKAEATVMAYKKRLENLGAVNQQMTDLEDQAANYLRQIMELEAQVKKSNSLQKQVVELEEQIAHQEKAKQDIVSAQASAAAEISELKSSLLAAERAKKEYEEEIVELRAQAEVAADGPDTPVASLAASTSAAADKERATRLKIENEALQQQVDELKKETAAQKVKLAAAATTAATVSTVSSASDSEQVAKLKKELEAKQKEINKISSDKDKLETYTKRTLAKFQEKYLVALQECKAKLKEKQDKIESLESRSASERTAQKREERLLSSTIYELGLAIMQNRLKER
mmetsp:Transcript_18304/g.49977  ORF Transcript_18304/g.49977 Transcript_18304/m.49977 type:complete len:586 (+) Transcript_18304:327-2084(+)|eukprot:CAMPEP_0168732104 /NCGR_PEP_ID=MMETSP0724-20121128/7603_1 /TAXON_ID=265536 /ORGANISM="Amphiprora sp., Strain CCMP467" /LENGTH=585 /DNA_ID=CAMNT_0008779121 /DNA_START=383 /DNA_END=2140 /DNA_ORIENTATION=-